MVRYSQQSMPLVTVLIPTYNRKRYLCNAIASVLNQTYQHLEVYVIRDGGESVSEIIQAFDDPRIRFIDRNENRGKAYSLNEAIRSARGKYVCYLDDDDVFYPDHVETLAAFLEANPEYGLAYTDLYKVHCKVLPDGRRIVLSKNVEVCRDFDRTVLLHFNYALHVSVMHRRDLLEKAGFYNEKLNVLIDWDLTRKLCFYTDFKHIPKVTGEYYAPIEDNDRISVQRRKDFNQYIVNLLTIRSTRPPKPWTMIEDLSVILLADTVDETLCQLINDIWSHSFYPHQIYLPLPQEQLNRLRTMVPNVLGVPVSQQAGEMEKIEAVLSVCNSRYIGIAPSHYKIDTDESMWIEKALNALIQSDDPTQAFELHESNHQQWAAVFRKEQLSRMKHLSDAITLQDAVLQMNINIRKPDIKEYPFQLDHVLKAAEELERTEQWDRAAKYFRYLNVNYGNDYWLKVRCSNALLRSGSNDDAVTIIKDVNQSIPTPASLLIEAVAQKAKGDYWTAIELLRQAERILTERETVCMT